jgi:hypothetical protein
MDYHFQKVEIVILEKIIGLDGWRNSMRSIPAREKSQHRLTT